jgi:hypothetical protein
LAACASRGVISASRERGVCEPSAAVAGSDMRRLGGEGEGRAGTSLRARRDA